MKTAWLSLTFVTNRAFIHAGIKFFIQILREEIMVGRKDKYFVAVSVTPCGCLHWGLRAPNTLFFVKKRERRVFTPTTVLRGHFLSEVAEKPELLFDDGIGGHRIFLPTDARINNVSETLDLGRTLALSAFLAVVAVKMPENKEEIKKMLASL